MKIIEKFVTYQGNECKISCFYNYCKNNNLDIEESEIFFLGNGFATIYEKKLIGKIDITLQSNISEAINDFCNTYKIIVKSLRNIDETYAKEITQDCILNNNPLIAKVDASYLSYNSIFNNAVGLNHYILIIGLSKDDVLISDGFVPRVPPICYQGWYNYYQLTQARKMKNYGCIIIDRNSLDYVKAERINNWSIELLQDKIYKGLEKYLTGSKNNNKYYGIKALQEFRNDMHDFLDLFGNEYMERIKILTYEIRTRGIITSRVLLEKALQKINNEGIVCTDKNFVEKMKNLNKKWNFFCFMLVKASISKKKETLEILSHIMNEIIDNEERLFNNILECK